MIKIYVILRILDISI